jgi:hypothetical protein
MSNLGISNLQRDKRIFDSHKMIFCNCLKCKSQSIFNSPQIKISRGRRKKCRLPLHVAHKKPHIVGLFVFCMRDCVGAIKCAAVSAKSATRALNEKQKVMLYKSYFGGKKGAALAGHGERGRFCAPCGMSVRFTAKQAHQHTHTWIRTLCNG